MSDKTNLVLSDWRNQVRNKAAELAENTLSFPLELRMNYFLGIVKQSRPKERHIDHWTYDVYNRLVDNYQDYRLFQSLSTEHSIAMAYLETYDDILSQTIPQSKVYPPKR